MPGKHTRAAPTATTPASKPSPDDAPAAGEPTRSTPPGVDQAVAHTVHQMFTRDVVYLVIAASQVLLATLVTPLITRTVPPAEYGEVVLAVTTMQLLGPIVSLGLPFAIQRCYADDGPDRARTLLASSTVAAVAAAVLTASTAGLWGPVLGATTPVDAALAGVWASLFALTWTCLAMMRSQERLILTAVVGGLQSFGAQAAGITLVLLVSGSATSYLAGATAAQAVAALIGLVELRPAWRGLRDRHYQTAALWFGLFMVPQQLSTFVLAAGDRFVVQHDLGSVATGRYSVAYNIGSLAVVLLIFVNQAWLPRIYGITDQSAQAHLLGSTRDAMSLLLTPVVVGLAVTAPLVLQLWAPSSFHPDELVPIVAIVATSTFAYGHFLANLRALLSLGRTARVAVLTTIAAVLNFVLNLALVPVFGIVGSAVATVAAYLVLAVVTTPARAGLRLPRIGRRALLAMVAATVLTLGFGVLPAGQAWTVVRAAVAVACVLLFGVLARGAARGRAVTAEAVIRNPETTLP